MSGVIWGLIMVAAGLFQLRELPNKNSWWVWTNWQARGWREHMSDDSYESIMKVCNILLVGLGLFFIYDETIGTQVIQGWIDSKQG